MKLSVKLLLTLGFVGGTGLLLSTGIQAVEQDQSSPQPPAVFQSYGDTIVVAKEPVKKMFSHSSHAIELELSCDSCHPDLFEKKGGAARAKGDYTMASLAEGMYCGACHDGDTAFGTEDPESCVTCHGSNMEQPETVVFSKPVKGVIFAHKAHAEDMGLDCAGCHDELFEMRKGAAEEQPDKFTMEALYAGQYCGSCHNGDDAFASDTRCTTCHIGVKGVERIYGGANGKDEGKH